jgi:hypothetical protein
MVGSVIPPARSEAAFQRGLVVALVLNERRLLARERIL